MDSARGGVDHAEEKTADVETPVTAVVESAVFVQVERLVQIADPISKVMPPVVPHKKNVGFGVRGAH